MRHFTGFLWVVCAAMLLASPAFASKKVALVIGNGAYAEAPLRNPTNDARAIAATLRSQGFEVLLKENATKVQMNEIVADFGEKLAEGDTALFFFAGHGMQVQGRNYLIPVDARITSEPRVRLETLDVDAVLDQMAAARARVSLVILDACRNNPFERRFRSVSGGLAQINAPEGTMVAYATAPGRVAADGEGANGLYTQELLRAMRQPGLKVEDIFKQVRINVSRASNGAQTPWEASSLTGDFYFQAALPVAAAAPAAAPTTATTFAPDREAMFWDSVKASTDPAELKAYLDAFPNGTFAPLATARIRSIENSRQQAVANPRVSAQAAAPAPQQAPQQTAARATNGTDFSQFNGQLTARVPAGVLISGAPFTFLTIAQSKLRFTAFMRSYGTDCFTCNGNGDLNADGTFVDVVIKCFSQLDETFESLASGTLSSDGIARVTLKSSNGRTSDIVFR
ncbi:MAG: caspase domain-containing protein [Rhodospirillales bacterium]